ncbi:glycosyltransferase family 4 protein [bacterium]|nr:glycosyltransferase family 4 protein [bacterium]
MSDRINILFTTSEGTLTGATHSLLYLAEGLADKGHFVYLACPQNSLLYVRLNHPNVKKMAVEFRNKFDIASIRTVRDIILQNSIDLINAQQSADRYISIFAKKLYKLPVRVIHTRRQKPLSSGGAIQRRFYVRNTSKIIAVSHNLKKTLVGLGYPANHIEVILNGMHPSFFERADISKTKLLREKFNIEKGERVIGCISRLKNQEQLIRAAALLPDDITLMFVGIEPGFFDVLTRQLDISNRIIYAGIVPREEVVDYYRLFDLFVLPSTMDGFGLVLVEAMGLGVPVIGTRSQGIVDVIDNEKNGLWFKDGDIHELADKIMLVLEDSKERKRITLNGMVAAREIFTIERTIDNYETFFKKLIANRV